MNAGNYSGAEVPVRKTFRAGYVFGAPIKDLGWFASLLMGLATGFIMFFAATFVGIVVVMVLNATGHVADYTISYRLVGLPVGVVSAVLALAYLGTFWVKRIAAAATRTVER
jgi:hypothetical protein